MLAMREYSIDDEGDEIQLSLYEGGHQVGGAVFPDEGDGSAFHLAYEVGQQWVGFPSATVSGLKFH